LGRKRKHGSGLPPYVYVGKAAYEWRPYDGSGGRLPYVKLVPLGAPMSEVWAAYERLQQAPACDLAWLLTSYLGSPQFRQHSDGKPKSNDTVREQERQVAFLIRYPRGAGKTFGSAPLKAITPGIVRKYLDARTTEGSPVAGNREITLISVAWTWALERDLISHPNPCRVVKRNTERARERYVTDQEYAVGYRLAANGPKWAQPAMEIAYLCRMRGGEIRRATKKDITPEGLETRRLKGSRDALTEWSERLLAAIAAGRATSQDSVMLLCDRKGNPITKTAWNSYWQRWQKKLEAAGIPPYTFHDLKAKGVSDFEGDKQAASGHRTLAQVAVYDRSKKRVKPTR
jgi:integrase